MQHYSESDCLTITELQLGYFCINTMTRNLVKWVLTSKTCFHCEKKLSTAFSVQVELTLRKNQSHDLKICLTQAKWENIFFMILKELKDGSSDFSMAPKCPPYRFWNSSVNYVGFILPHISFIVNKSHKQTKSVYSYCSFFCWNPPHTIVLPEILTRAVVASWPRARTGSLGGPVWPTG